MRRFHNSEFQVVLGFYSLFQSSVFINKHSGVASLVFEGSLGLTKEEGDATEGAKIRKITT